MKRVLVTRASEDGERTAEKLCQLGFEPVLSPVLEVAPTAAAIPEGRYDAILATSPKALLCVGETAGGLRETPLHLVGARSAKIARQSGWRADLVAEDAQSLVPLLRSRYKEPAHFLYLAGRDRKAELEEALRAERHLVTAVETYEARAARSLTSEAAAALREGEIAAVLHYSKRSAELFLVLAQSADLFENLRGLMHIALSQEIAGALHDANLPHVLVAERPNEEHLLQLLAKSGLRARI